MKTGIYLLANNSVCEQVVALINSIEANYSKDIPICIIPFDSKIDRLSKELANRKNVSFFENKNSIEKWDKFVSEVHQLYYAYPHEGVKSKRTEILQMHRKYCAFDGSFEKFIYLDSDTLIFQSLEPVFQKLDEFDFVVHDFQRFTDIRLKTVNYYYEAFNKLYDSEEIFAQRFHCSGFWASRKEAITEEDLAYFIQELAKGDIKIFKTPWHGEDIRQLSEQSLLNYMTLKKEFKLYNFTLDKSSEQNTGSCVTSLHFEDKNHILYDHEQKLTYLHYMGIKNERLRRLVKLNQINLPFKKMVIYLADKLFKWQIRSIPYKDVFLYYRFLRE